MPALGSSSAAPGAVRLDDHQADRASGRTRPQAFAERDLSGVDYVYLWVDGIVRHEALCDRVGVKGPRRPVVVATG